MPIRAAEMIGQCAAIKKIEAMIPRIGQNRDVAVLINGETGTGKEVVAQLIHVASGNGQTPLIEVNCAGIPDQLLESELFGHEKGAFTGALQNKRGLLELAHGGTLLLDEIGEMSMGLQAKLLKAIEEKNFRRVGGEALLKVDVRIIACTNADLQVAIAEERFRQDLYFRLNEVQLQLPPLRQRQQDVLLLAHHFIDQFAAEYDLPPTVLAEEAAAEFCRYPWPGNIRQLRNTIKRAMLLNHRPALRPTLDRPLGGPSAEKPHPLAVGGRHLVIDVPDDGVSFDEIEKQVIAHMLHLNNWNKNQTCRKLKISYPRLLRKIANYALSPTPTSGAAL